MNDTLRSNSPIESAYRERTPGSARMAARAADTFPSGIVHDARRMHPYALYVDRAAGPRKWDIDGNEYIDYFGGHGALILGHNRPEVMEAIARQLERGTHYAACSELEVEWGERVRELVPCAERVRFTSSGTEANLMALRLARAYTGRDKVVRFMGHFHGWHDHMAFGYDNHFDGSPSPGVLPGIAENVLMASPDDLEGTVALLGGRDDIAAIILEPTGGSFGFVPMSASFVEAVANAAREHGVVLIFDEVVTGFRVSPGGAQAHYGITPDLATFAKILAGGLPGGAVTGRQDILDLLDFDVARRRGIEKVAHQGTFNANPTCAAAGLTALGIVAREDACARATAQAAKLRDGVNAMLSERGIPWAAYGTHSAVYIFTNPDGVSIDPLAFDAEAVSLETFKRVGSVPGAAHLRLALLVHGVDISGKPGGLTSAAHGDLEIEATLEAFGNAFDMLAAERKLPGA